MKIRALLFVFLWARLACARSVSSQDANRYWITDVIIVSPESLDHVEAGSVLVEDGRIAQVGRGRALKVPAGATVISGKGGYLIPGLIDSHVHLASVPGMSFEPNSGLQGIVQSYLRQLPRSYLYYGYTTLVDLAVSNDKLLQDFRRTPEHPDLYDCGESLPFANGYPMSFAPPAVRFTIFPNFVYDPMQAESIPAEYKPEDHTPAADIARVKAAGGICVKTYFERGFAKDKHLPVMSPEVLAEIRKLASRQALVLMMHANSFEAQKFAAGGNVDVIAHGMWHWGALDNQPEVPDEIKSLLDEIVAKRIGYQPTIQVLYGELAYFDPEYLKTEAIARVVPRQMLEWFHSPDGQWFGRELNEDSAPGAQIIRNFEDGPLRRVRLVTVYLAKKDANFIFGTDTPSAPTYGNLPGLNGYLEMKQLQKAGLSLRQILAAATISNAREFRIDSQVGTIEPGKVANLVLMKSSPLESLDAYDSITAVWVHGKMLSRDTLAANSSPRP